jgi:hypothetical protein
VNITSEEASDWHTQISDARRSWSVKDVWFRTEFTCWHLAVQPFDNVPMDRALLSVNVDVWDFGLAHLHTDFPLPEGNTNHAGQYHSAKNMNRRPRSQPILRPCRASGTSLFRQRSRPQWQRIILPSCGRQPPTTAAPTRLTRPARASRRGGDATAPGHAALTLYSPPSKSICRRRGPARESPQGGTYPAHSAGRVAVCARGPAPDVAVE